MALLMRFFMLACGLTIGVLAGLSAPWQQFAAQREPSFQPPRMMEATVYLPLADNQGRKFTESEWQEALELIVRPFGGATLGQSQEGCWIGDDKRLNREWVRPVVISFAPDRLEEFRQAARAAGRKLGQEAVYARFEQPGVDLLFVDDSLTADVR